MINRGTIRRTGAALYDRLRRQQLSSEFAMAKSSGALQIGRETYGLPQVARYEGSDGNVIIGSFCSIGPNVEFIAGGYHPSDWVSTFPFRIRWHLEGAYSDGMPYSKGDIVVGSDVWIGTGALVLSGVTIGHGAIVGAHAVVANDVPPYAVVIGNPARVIRMRFPPETVDQLLAIAWWEWPEEVIREEVHLLSSTRIGEFIVKFTNGRPTDEQAP